MVFGLWSRRIVLPILVSLQFLTLAGQVCGAAERPNVIFILADDLGYRELGCYGQEKIRTPNIDSLARDGMLFTRHYSGNAVCAPSRCVLMTGKHPGHAHVRNNRPVRPEGQLPIPEEEFTLAEMFHRAGYATGAFGKWGLGPTGSSGDPNKQGFDRFFGFNCQAKAHTYYPPTLWDNDKLFPLDNDPPVPGHAGLPEGSDPSDPVCYDQFKGQDYAPERINLEALRFIQDNHEKPFFLYYPTIIPHVALHVPDIELRPYLDLGWNDPPFTREKGGYTPHFTPRAAYAAMISLLDKYVGRILLQLRILGIEDNTIVIFTSDNGTTHLREEVDYEFFNSVGELKGLKGQLDEGGVRVPLLVRWPGHIAPGSVQHSVSGFEDWMPTLHDLAQLEGSLPERIDGVSLAPALLGRTDSLERPFLYREFQGYGGQQAVWTGPWKGIRRQLHNPRNRAVADSPIELYRISSDPSESENLADSFPDVVQALREIMEDQHTPSKLFPLSSIDPGNQR